MAAVAAVRASGRTRWPVLIAVQATAPLLLLPALPLALVSALRGRRSHALGYGALAAAGLSWARHDTPDPRGAGPAEGPGTPLRLLTANLLTDNPTAELLPGMIRASDADVVVLQEVTPEHAALLQESGLWEDYPHRVLDARPWVLGAAILSRLPLRSGGTLDIAGGPMVEAEVETPNGPLRVVGVHATAPLSPAQTRHWKVQLEALSRLEPPPGGTLILAGDFNAATQHRAFRTLLDQGLRDAYLLAGRGLGATYPKRRVMPAVMRIDHILVGTGVTAVRVRRRLLPGSDHYGLEAELRITGAAAAPARP